MNAHRAVIEAGPSTIRRLCCGTSAAADDGPAQLIAAALGAVDDRVTLVGEQPVAVVSLWSDALRSAVCTRADGMVVVHPSWWSSSRIGTLSSAAAAVSDDVLVRPRSWLLSQAAQADGEPTIVVEITDGMVVVGGAELIAIPRRPPPRSVAGEVVSAVAGMPAAVVLIDAPGSVREAPALAASIAGTVRSNGQTALHIDDTRLVRLARSVASDRHEPTVAPGWGDRVRSRAQMLRGLGAAAVVLAVSAPAATTVGRHRASTPPPAVAAPTTFLVEGRVAVTVPADWPAQRVIVGPGSARVQVTSPSDPEVALHVTQSPVTGETLSGTAERLKRAIEAEPDGSFVDFNASGTSVGRPAVTYREVRAGHDVRWTVLLDGPVRIGLGCQSRPGKEEAVRAVCEQAVRSAHAIG